MTKAEQEMFEKRLDDILNVAEKSLGVADKALELGRNNATAQKITTNNISKLEKVVENVITDSPKIAIMETNLKRVNVILTRLLWSAGAGAISLIVYLSTHNIVIK